VALGAWCLITGDPSAYFMLGVAYAGAGAGRVVSMVIDKPPQPKALIWFALEGGPALFLILANT